MTVAHNSAGPKEDIIVPAYPLVNGEYSVETLRSDTRPVGFLAASVEEYVKALSFILSHEAEMRRVSDAAREQSRLFSTERFVKAVKDKMATFLVLCVCENRELNGILKESVLRRIQMDNLFVESAGSELTSGSGLGSATPLLSPALQVAVHVGADVAVVEVGDQEHHHVPDSQHDDVDSQRDGGVDSVLGERALRQRTYRRMLSPVSVILAPLRSQMWMSKEVPLNSVYMRARYATTGGKR